MQGESPCSCETISSAYRRNRVYILLCVELRNSWLIALIILGFQFEAKLLYMCRVCNFISFVIKKKHDELHSPCLRENSFLRALPIFSTILKYCFRKVLSTRRLFRSPLIPRNSSKYISYLVNIKIKIHRRGRTWSATLSMFRERERLFFTFCILVSLFQRCWILSKFYRLFLKGSFSIIFPDPDRFFEIYFLLVK